MLLGDEFASICKNLCIDASNYGCAWLHMWLEDGIKLSIINPAQIIPIFDNSISSKLTAVIRTYSISIDNSETKIFEFWDEQHITSLYLCNNQLTPFYMFNSNKDYRAKHGFSFIPFIPFKNNNLATPDLDSIKSLIDVYDKIFSGFVNDIEDIQQVIFILTNYGGQDLNTFLSDLKRYKTVDMQSTGPSDKSALSTLTIDIPVDARNDLLKMTRKQIFISGLGVDPENEHFGNSSGVALKHLYALLELKAGLMETEFRLSFAKLIRFLLKFLNKNDNIFIEQSYFRSNVQNDLERANIINALKDVTSIETIVKNNPLVDDYFSEIEKIKEN